MIAEAVALGVAVEYLAGLGMEHVRAARAGSHGLHARAAADDPGLRVVGPRAAGERGGLVSFTIDGMHPHDVAELVGRRAVCIRAGHHCAQPLMRCLGVGATARASVSVYNETTDVDELIEALQAGRTVFGL